MPGIIGYGSSPSRCGPSLALDTDGQSRDIPASGAIASWTRRVLKKCAWTDKQSVGLLARHACEGRVPRRKPYK